MSPAPAARIVWITGLPASGKSTLAARVVAGLRDRGVAALNLDGDAVRSILTPEPSYSESERDGFYRMLGDLALLVARGGVTAVISATASRRAYRDRVRQQFPAFVEVHLKCDPDTLRARDPKQLYLKSERGEIAALPGAGAPYEAPLAPELVLDGDRESPEALSERVLRALATDPFSPSEAKR